MSTVHGVLKMFSFPHVSETIPMVFNLMFEPHQVLPDYPRFTPHTLVEEETFFAFRPPPEYLRGPLWFCPLVPPPGQTIGFLGDSQGSFGFLVVAWCSLKVLPPLFYYSGTVSPKNLNFRT